MPKTIPTVRSLARQSRRLDRQARSQVRHELRVGQVLGELRRGAVLQLSYEPRRLWRLSTGEFVSDAVASTVIGLPNVVGVGDALPLFAGELSQTWRFTDGGEEVVS
jgi:hypothetical protein